MARLRMKNTRPENYQRAPDANPPPKGLLQKRPRRQRDQREGKGRPHRSRFQLDGPHGVNPRHGVEREQPVTRDRERVEETSQDPNRAGGPFPQKQLPSGGEENARREGRVMRGLRRDQAASSRAFRREPPSQPGPPPRKSTRSREHGPTRPFRPKSETRRPDSWETRGS